MEEMIKKVSRVLKKVKIPYVIIGGIPASIWGKPRMTVDTDIILSIPENKIDLFLDLLKTEKFKVYPLKKIEEKLKMGLPVKIAYTKHFSIDLRKASYSLDRKAIERAKNKRIFNISLKICSREDLIIYKLIRFQEIDIFDIKNVILRWKKRIDWQYIENSLQEFSKEIGSEEVLLNFEKIKELIRR